MADYLVATAAKRLLNALMAKTAYNVVRSGVRVMEKQAEFHRDNHFVPRVYLKQFSGTDGRVATYRTLVSHERAALWKRRPARSIGYVAHLYTRMAAGCETDEIERWLDRDFESPAKEALRKATSDERLRPDEWEKLARFVAAQDVRTPARLLQNLERWETTAPRMLEEVMDKAVEEFRQAKKQGVRLVHRVRPADNYIPIRVTAEEEHRQGIGKLKVEMVAGRGLWFSTMHHLLTRTLKHLEGHRWTILRPPDELTWFTSDDPVIRLNYYGEGKYDLKGGWGNTGTEILLPLGPRHLLCCQVGEQPPQRGTTLSRPQAEMIRRFIAEHAFRSIFAVEADPEVAIIRPRVVNARQVRDESEQWRRWHVAQSEAELRFAEG